MPGYRTPLAATALTVAATFSPANLAAPGAEFATTREGIVGTYRRAVPDDDFEISKARDEKAKPRVMERQQELLRERYDLSDRPSKLMMSGGRRAVQEGVRVRLPSGMSWEKLSQMTPDQVKAQGAFPNGFLPLPHVKLSRRICSVMSRSVETTA